jgi:succinate dehydrogenase/fumarate reductase flavoprotein subunit
MGGSLTADAMNGFYGHLVASPLSHLKPGDFTVLTQYNSCFGVLVDRNGDRFTDESKGDHWNAQAVLELEGALAYLIFDERIRRREQILPSLVGELDTTSDKLLECGQRGARYHVANSLPKLAAAMSGWGVPEKVLSTVEHFNEVVRSGHGGDLHPARRNLQAAIDEPPYAVLEVMPAITFTYGGLTTDSVGRVLDDQGQAVPGLLAAGADMGGVFRRGYAGGLASALVFGLRAGEEAAAGAVR